MNLTESMRLLANFECCTKKEKLWIFVKACFWKYLKNCNLVPSQVLLYNLIPEDLETRWRETFSWHLEGGPLMPCNARIDPTHKADSALGVDSAWLCSPWLESLSSKETTHGGGVLRGQQCLWASAHTLMQIQLASPLTSAGQEQEAAIATLMVCADSQPHFLQINCCLQMSCLVTLKQIHGETSIFFFQKKVLRNSNHKTSSKAKTSLQCEGS